MKNIGFIILIFAVLLIGNIFTVYKYISLKTNAAQIVNTDRTTITNLNEEIEITRGDFRQSLNWQYQYEGQTLGAGKVVNQQGIQQDLHSIAKGSDILIYRITDSSCDAAMTKLLLNLSKSVKRSDLKIL